MIIEYNVSKIGMVNVFPRFPNTITKTGGSLITDCRQFREYVNIGSAIASKIVLAFSPAEKYVFII